MKTEKQLRTSAASACKKSISLAIGLAKDMNEIGTGGDPKKIMPSVRAQLAELNQRVHEFNAYDNSLTT